MPPSSTAPSSVHRLEGEVGIDAEDEQDDVLQHEEGAEGGQHDQHLVAVVHELQDAAFQHQAEHHADQDRGDEDDREAGPVGPAGVGRQADEEGRGVGAPGVEGCRG